MVGGRGCADISIDCIILPRPIDLHPAGTFALFTRSSIRPDETCARDRDATCLPMQVTSIWNTWTSSKENNSTHWGQKTEVARQAQGMPARGQPASTAVPCDRNVIVEFPGRFFSWLLLLLSAWLNYKADNWGKFSLCLTSEVVSISEHLPPWPETRKHQVSARIHCRGMFDNRLTPPKQTRNRRETAGAYQGKCSS
jgi:hypothetical protein